MGVTFRLPSRDFLFPVRSVEMLVLSYSTESEREKVYDLRVVGGHIDRERGEIRYDRIKQRFDLMLPATQKRPYAMDPTPERSGSGASGNGELFELALSLDNRLSYKAREVDARKPLPVVPFMPEFLVCVAEKFGAPKMRTAALEAAVAKARNKPVREVAKWDDAAFHANMEEVWDGLWKLCPRGGWMISHELVPGPWDESIEVLADFSKVTGDRIPNPAKELLEYKGYIAADRAAQAEGRNLADVLTALAAGDESQEQVIRRLASKAMDSLGPFRELFTMDDIINAVVGRQSTVKPDFPTLTKDVLCRALRNLLRQKQLGWAASLLSDEELFEPFLSVASPEEEDRRTVYGEYIPRLQVYRRQERISDALAAVFTPADLGRDRVYVSASAELPAGMQGAKPRGARKRSHQEESVGRSINAI